MALAWQPTFGDLAAPAFDPSLRGVARHHLDAWTWVDHVPGWLEGSGAVLDELLADQRWEQRERVVYDVRHREPRLTLEIDGVLPGILDAARSALSAHYGVVFDSCWCNLYRDGRDSVAWHRDRIHRVLTDPLVVTISLGVRRPFLLRRRGASGATTAFQAGEGDLLVMGGACQHDWEHSVPKRAGVAGPRLSVTMRHSR